MEMDLSKVEVEESTRHKWIKFSVFDVSAP